MLGLTTFNIFRVSETFYRIGVCRLCLCRYTVYNDLEPSLSFLDTENSVFGSGWGVTLLRDEVPVLSVLVSRERVGLRVGSRCQRGVLPIGRSVIKSMWGRYTTSLRHGPFVSISRSREKKVGPW